MPSPTSPPKAPPAPVRFGPGGRFELRPLEYRLLVDGQPAALGGRALDLLMVMAARPADLHTKGELLDLVWPGLVVEEGNLRVQVNALRKLIGEDTIATVPGRGYRFNAAVVAANADTVEAPSAAAASTRTVDAGGLRLFGRDADLARLRAALRTTGACTTLVGTPGIGKSSLARGALARWTGRSAWVDLAPLTQGSQIAGAIARALGGSVTSADTQPDHDDDDTVAQVLALLPTDTALLLVLDNAEHLVDRCATWVARLQAVPTVHLLVTSQVPLSVAGERVHRLDALPVADGVDGPDAQEGAVALLIDRIRAADNRFEVTQAALPLLASVCRQLDGLPLALEMAAARVPLMGLQGVHDALAERFALLSRGRRDSPARHRSLQAALAWSYGLLNEQEQRLFRTLGVCAGGFTLDLAVVLSTDEHVGRWDVVDNLATLVERSLVSVDGGDPPRYRLLETMRAYAREMLAAEDPADSASAHRRHAAAVLALFARSGAEAECLAEMENAREAFVWARANDLALAAQLSGHTAGKVGFTVWRQEVSDWMMALWPAMREPAAQILPLQVQAAWWGRLAYVLAMRRDPAGCDAAQRAAALWRQLDNPERLLLALADVVRSIARPGPALDTACDDLRQQAALHPLEPSIALRVQGALAEAARARGDHAALLACRIEELRLAREIGWNGMAQAAETNICAALIDLGRNAEAAERARALLQRLDASGDTNNANLLWALYMLGESLVQLGAFDEARALVPRLLAAEERFGSAVAWYWALALVDGQGRVAATGRLIGYVRHMQNRRKDKPTPEQEQLLDRLSAAVRARLGDETAAALAAEGRAMDDATAAALAAGTTD